MRNATKLPVSVFVSLARKFGMSETWDRKTFVSPISTYLI